MSLYTMQKFLFQLNREPEVQRRFAEDRAALLAEYALEPEEYEAMFHGDIGKLYVLGCNGQLLMHFAALHRIEWNDYLELMRQGLRKHGPVREGVYAATGYEGIEAHDARLKREREAR